MDQQIWDGTRNAPSASSQPPWSSQGMRPLSDIREITEPSLLEATSHRAHTSRADSQKRTDSAAAALLDTTPRRSWQQPRSRHTSSRANSQQSARSPFSSRKDHRGHNHVYSIPPSNVPPRSSSQLAQKPGKPFSAQPAFSRTTPGRYKHIPNRGRSESPVAEAANRLNPLPQRATRVPSKTIIKVENPSSKDILDHPTYQHPRLKVDLLMAAPLFVGGSSVEGTVRIIVDEAVRYRHRKFLTLERVSVDLLGIEELSATSKRNVFLSLGNELIDLAHPPPEDMVEVRNPGSPNPRERAWILVPSVSHLPFLITLPLEVGPPPFESRHAKIRYMLCATLTIKDAGKQLCVRCTQNTHILSVYDPEKALMSLPSPLTATDENCYRGRVDENIIVTAGLHRQVWVSGTTLFADVHIVNNSHRTIKKLELHLERVIICYRHAPAATLETSASPARLFDQVDRSIISRAVLKHGTPGWSGVLAHTTELRTCDLELPRGHATIKCNKYFEVRYSLSIVVSTSYRKLVTVQLPIILIHMNSLDVPTNSVAQVAAAIEEKRAAKLTTSANGSPRIGRRPSQVLQGRAFNAPRMQSLDRERARQEDLRHLGHILDSSPRKHSPRKASFQVDRLARKLSSSFSFKTPPSNRRGRIIPDHEADELRQRLGHVRSFGSIITNKSIANPKISRAASAMSSYNQEAENARLGTMSSVSALTSNTGLRSKHSMASFEVKAAKAKWPNASWKPTGKYP